MKGLWLWLLLTLQLRHPRLHFPNLGTQDKIFPHQSP